MMNNQSQMQPHLTAVTFNIDGMTCNHCVATIERTVRTVSGVKKAAVSLRKREARVTFNPAETSTGALKNAITDAGYFVVGEAEPTPQSELPAPPKLSLQAKAAILLLTYAVGLLSGFLVWGLRPFGDQTPGIAAAPTAIPTATPIPVLPAEYTLPISFGDLGPKLVEAGAIDYEKFVQVYQSSGTPLSDEQLTILSKGSDTPIVFNRHNAYFLLNFFWALGLTNKSSLLTDGAMVQNSGGNVARFASTGGWTIGSKPVTELYASTPLVPLTPEQAGILAAVATAVYRPCCNNPTAFPDCNHGMAMLGMLEVLAANGATEDELFEAAKYANAFWFPQQSEEIATFFRNAKNVTFEQIDGRDFVGPYVASSSGYQAVHQWLTENNLLPQAPSSNNSCGV